MVALLLAGVALCAWGYVTLRHRAEKQLLVYSITTRLKASDITQVSHSGGTTKIPATSLGQSGKTRLYLEDSVKPSDIVLDDEMATKEVKDVARDIMTWCFSRWGGPFGARAGSDSMGVKLGIWNDRFENVRCAVMLLALRQVNAVMNSELKDHSSRTGSGDPGKMLCDTSLPAEHAAQAVDCLMSFGMFLLKGRQLIMSHLQCLPLHVYMHGSFSAYCCICCQTKPAMFLLTCACPHACPSAVMSVWRCIAF